MQLEVNKNHKSFNLDKNKAIKKTKIAISGLLVTISLYSGVLLTDNVYAIAVEGATNNDSKYEFDYEGLFDHPKDEEVLSLDITDNSSLKFLQEFSNLKELQLCFYQYDVDNLNSFPDLPNLKKLYVDTIEFNGDISEEDKYFLEKCKSLDELTIGGFYVGPNTVENLTNLKKLTFETGTTLDCDFKKLDFLKELSFENVLPYDLAISFTEEECNYLLDHHVKIDFGSSKNCESYLKACKELDEIVKELNINDNMTDSEKMKKIVLYIIDHVSYDPEVADCEDYDKMVNIVDKKGFYDGGFLKGALEKDTQICGNISALGEALFKRCGLKSTMAASDTHLWNLICVDDENYCLDMTFLDDFYIKENNREITAKELIERDRFEEAIFYMADPSPKYMHKLDRFGYHDYLSYPDYMNDKTFSIRFDDKELAVPFGVFVGILTMFGGGMVLRNRTKKNRKVK